MSSSGIKFRRRLRIVVLIGLLPALIIAVAEVEHFKSSAAEPVTGGVFAGLLPGLGQIRFDVFVDGSNATAWLYQEGAGNLGWVSLNFEPAGNMHADLVSGDGKWATNGTMDFRIAKDGGRLEGNLILISNRPPRLFTLARVYEHRAVSRRSGLVFGRFGANASFVGEFPLLPGTSAFQTALNQKLAQETGAEAAKKTVGDWNRKWDILRHGPWVEAHIEEYWQPVCITNSIASFAVFNFPDYGQNGNPDYWTSRNYWWSDGKLREFELVDLFCEGSEWKAAIRKFCSEELMHLDKPGAAADMNGPGTELKLFTLSSTGIQIYINPYVIAAGVEGAFVFHIPYARLQPFLRTNGPAAAFARLVASR